MGVEVMYKLVLISLMSLFIISCVSNKTLQTVKAGDYDMNCAQLKYELSGLGAKFEDAEDESGLTGKNVALGIFFWPGIIVNERQAGRNEDSINDRIVHLNALYSQKCVGQESD